MKRHHTNAIHRDGTRAAQAVSVGFAKLAGVGQKQANSLSLKKMVGVNT